MTLGVQMIALLHFVIWKIFTGRENLSLLLKLTAERKRSDEAWNSYVSNIILDQDFIPQSRRTGQVLAIHARPLR